MEPDSTFSSLALSKAWHNSRALFRSRLQGGLVTIASIVLGAGAQWTIDGLSPNGRSLLGTFACTIIVAVVLVSARFLWHLFLAPSEIVYSAISSVLESTLLYGVAHPVNYSIWKWQKTYSAGEFAALLAGMDPSSQASTVNSRSFLNLVLEGLRSNELRYARPLGMGPDGSYNPDIGARIAKEDALEWAEVRGYREAISQLR